MIQKTEGGKGNDTLGSVPGFSGRRRYAEGGEVAAQPHRCFTASVLAVFAGCALGFLSLPALADSSNEDSATWYIVGGPEDVPSNYGDKLAIGSRPARIDFGVTFARTPSRDLVNFTSGPTSPRSEGDAGYAFLVSGAYGIETGTLVTPRIVGGIGVSSLGIRPDRAPGDGDPTTRQEMAPTALIGFGADFDLGDSWALSAEYRAMYLGETEQDGRLTESRLDQKFVVGAKIRF